MQKAKFEAAIHGWVEGNKPRALRGAALHASFQIVPIGPEILFHVT